MIVSARTLLPLLAVLLSGPLAGCDLFGPRDPEPPIDEGSGFEVPTAPNILLDNLRRSITEANAIDYRRNFSDGTAGLPSFRFTPASDGASIDPGLFANWTVAEEEEYIRDLFSELVEGGIASLVLTPPDVSEAALGDSLLYAADYALNVPHTRSGVEREAFGRFVVTMKLSERNEWYITAWQDIALDDRSTWSVIKARFAR